MFITATAAPELRRRIGRHMESPYRDSLLQAVTGQEECTCAHACFACRTRVTKLAHEARAARAHGRLNTIALLAAGVMAGAFICECTGLTAALERLAEAARQSNAVALHLRPTPTPTPTPARAPALVPPLVPSPQVAQAGVASELFEPCGDTPAACRAQTLARIRSAIVREGDTRYLLDRRLIDLVLEEQANLMRSVRVVPVSAHGGTYARLFGVRPDSLLGMLGFRDGDLLESINGFDLSTPERALEAYAWLRTADVLEARVIRAGQTVMLLYRFW